MQRMSLLCIDNRLATTIKKVIHSDENEQTVGFTDATAGFTNIVDSAPDTTYSIGNYGDSGLGSFLSRPVRIADYNWELNTSLSETFDPWRQFFTDPAVAKRIDNYALLRCKLRVKLVVNATPFHYGRAIMHYQPWQGYDSTADIANDSRIISYSQRPKIFVDPSNSQGGEMTLPFFHLENWIDVTSITSLTEMGQMQLTSINDLKHANDGSHNISVTIFAWAEDLELCVPTTKLSAQSGAIPPNYISPITIGLSVLGATSLTVLTYILIRLDDIQNNCLTAQAGKRNKYSTSGPSEYTGGGAISKPASAIAAAAGELTSIPFIAPFAMATKIAAGAVAGIAKIFGFSRPAILTNPIYVKPKYVSNLATCDTPETVSKLTVDSKQEITVDPRTTGLGGVDEMTLKSITQRESYLTTFDWTPTETIDTLLYTSQVAPMVEEFSLIPGGVRYHPTALSFATWPFRNWSGTIVYRFQIVCTKFHHGRLRFTYEPRGNAASTATAFNTVYTKIIDIGVETDFEMCIAWADKAPYKLTGWNKITNHYESGTGSSIVPEPLYDNGIFTVRVLNELTAPSDNAAIHINVFVKAGDDFELCNPVGDHLRDISYFPPIVAQAGLVAQSGELEEPGTDNHPEQAPCQEFVGAPSSTSHLKNQIFFGESITSFRTLLRRYNKYRTWSYNMDANGIEATDDIIHNSIYFPQKPYSRGFALGGDLSYDYSDVQIPLTIDDAAPYNFVNMTLLKYLTPAYVGYRGALRSKIIPRFSKEIMRVTTSRNYSDTIVAGSSTSFPITQRSPREGWQYAAANGLIADNDCLAGTVLHPFANQPATEVEWPFMTGKRFAFARNIGQNENRDDTFNVKNKYSTDVLFSSFQRDSPIDEYIATGEDFSLFFFLNAPVRYEYEDPGAGPPTIAPGP